MNTLSDEEILHAVSDLEPRWQELLGNSGATAAQSLLAVAAADKSQAQQAANKLLELFEQPGAKATLREQIQAASFTKGITRLYNPPPGQAGPIAVPGIIYRCPVRGCGVTWEQQVAGETVPTCYKHPDRRLIPK